MRGEREGEDEIYEEITITVSRERQKKNSNKKNPKIKKRRGNRRMR